GASGRLPPASRLRALKGRSAIGGVLSGEGMVSMLRVVLACLLALPVVVSAQGRARNVVLFLADAGGVPTINAASWHGYQAPRRLFLQHMPHIGLSETSPTNGLVTDSAAGMTATVTGQKTPNGACA